MPGRIQLKRTKGWRKPDGAVVVARPGPFGNPFTVGEHSTPEGAVAAFADWLAGNPWACPQGDTYEPQRATILRRLPELRGKDLACWCPPGQPCHADVLLQRANQ